MKNKSEATQYRNSALSIIQWVQVVFITLKVIPFGEVGNWSWWAVFIPTLAYVPLKAIVKLARRMSDKKTIHFDNGATKQIDEAELLILMKGYKESEANYQAIGNPEECPDYMINFNKITHID